MLEWRFNTYVNLSGRRDVQTDIDRLDDRGLANFAAQVKYLAIADICDWHEPKAKKLVGPDGLYEIRFKAHNNATRAIGFFGPGPQEFTILIICNHKGNVYKPAHAIETAASRRKQIHAEVAGFAPLTIDGEDYPPTDEA